VATETTLLPDDAATADFGARLAATLRPGELVLLMGDLGAGKTALARALIRTLLDDPELDVPSPSFSLVQPYEGQGVSVLHADLYRLASPREIDELGLFDRPEAIVLVEWPERDPELFERADVTVHLAIAPGGGRVVSVERRARDGLRPSPE
jgi:tRNA threonylcarbamoyl adenosine modification protein YjeE